MSASPVPDTVASAPSGLSYSVPARHATYSFNLFLNTLRSLLYSFAQILVTISMELRKNIVPKLPRTTSFTLPISAPLEFITAISHPFHHRTPQPNVPLTTISVSKPPTGVISVPSSPGKFILPDLVSHCTYPLRVNVNCYDVARASEKWLLAGANHNEAKSKKFMGLKAGELTAQCYPDTDAFHLRVCDDFMNWLFNMDDWLDEFDVADTHGMHDCCIAAMRDPYNFRTDKGAGKLTKSFFGRFCQDGGPGCTERFIHTMDLFFKAVAIQAADRARGAVPDLESYITVRRDTSGCKPCFALIEFAAKMDLPDEVAHHPLICSLEEATNDLVTWSNDIFSWNVEQSRHDTHNMIPVIMKQRSLTLQEAVDFVGDLCEGSIERFERDRAALPSWGPELDAQVATYVDGLQNWIVGSLHWSFDSERYFGKDGLDIKRHRVVHLLPKRPL